MEGCQSAQRRGGTPRTFLKPRMPSCPNLRPDMSHRLATPYFAPIGKEIVHLNLTNLIKGGGEGRENLMGDIRNSEGFDNALACSFLEVFQIEFWVTPNRIRSTRFSEPKGGRTHCQLIDIPPSHYKAMDVQGLLTPIRGSTAPSRSAADCSHPMRGRAETSDVHCYLQ